MSEATFGVKIVDRTRAGALAAGRSFDELRRKAGETGKAVGLLDGTFTKLGAALGAYVGFRAIKGQFTEAARAALDFGAAMSEVSTLLKDTSGMAALTTNVRALTREFGGDHVTEAKALYQIISAGATDAAQATDLLRVSNQLALGGVTDVATAADGLTTILNAWKTEAGSATQVSDKLFASMRMGKTTVGELSQGISYVASIAAQTGISLDEVLAATVALTLQGVPTTRAMRGLGQVVSAMVKPSSEAAEESERLGFVFNAEALKAKGLTGMLDEVARATAGSAESQALLFGGVEALGPIMALTGKGGDDFASALDGIAQSAGEAGIAVAKMMEDSATKLKQLKANWEDLQITAGAAILRLSEGPVSSLTASLTTLNDRLAKGIPLWQILLANAIAFHGPPGTKSDDILERPAWAGDRRRAEVAGAWPMIGAGASRFASYAGPGFSTPGQAVGVQKEPLIFRQEGSVAVGGGGRGAGPSASLLELLKGEQFGTADQSLSVLSESFQLLGRKAKELADSLPIQKFELWDEAMLEMAAAAETAGKLLSLGTSKGGRSRADSGLMSYDQVIGSAGYQKGLYAFGDVNREEDQYQLGKYAGYAPAGEANSIDKLATARERESNALQDAQKQQLAYERVLRSGLGILKQVAPESALFFDAAASFFSGDILGGTLNIIGAIVEQTGWLKDNSAKIRDEIEKLASLNAQINTRAGDSASALMKKLQPEGYITSMESALRPLQQLYESVRAQYPGRSEFEQMNMFLMDVGQVTKSFASGSFLSGDGGVASYKALLDIINDMGMGENFGEGFARWQEQLESVFGGSGTLMEAASTMLDMEGAVEGVRAAAKSTTAQLDSQSAAQRLWLAGQEMRIRAEFAPQFQNAGGDVIRQRQVYQAMMQQIESLTYRSGSTAGTGATGETTGGEVASKTASTVGGTVDASGVTVTPLVAVAGDFIQLPTEADFAALYTGEGGLAARMTAGLHRAFDHYRGVLAGVHLKPYGDDALYATNFIEFPTADEFLAEHGGEGGGKVGSLADTMPNGIHGAMAYYRSVLAGVHLKPYGDDALLPTEFLELPDREAFLALHGTEGGGAVGSLADAMPNGIHGAMAYYRGVLADVHLKPYGDDALTAWDYLEFPTADDFLALHGGAGGGAAGSLADAMPNGIHGAMTYYRSVLAATHLKPYGDDALAPRDFIEFPTADEFAAIHAGKGGGAVGSLADAMPNGIHGAMAYYRSVLAATHLKPYGDDALLPRDFIEFPTADEFLVVHGGAGGGAAGSLADMMPDGIHGAMTYYRSVLSNTHLKPYGDDALTPAEFLQFPSEDQFHAMHGYGSAGGSSTSLQFIMTRGIPDAMSYYRLILTDYKVRLRPQDTVSFPVSDDFFYYFLDNAGAVSRAIQAAVGAMIAAVSPVTVDLSRLVRIDTSGFNQAVAAAVNEGISDRTVQLPGGGSYTPY
ncbi:MAG: phage tail tape measure protein [Treponema sp. GWB1_62_6]|nr:MAG: phage tail tape measure protein [Treponema sp. GWB1_62_6]